MTRKSARFVKRCRAWRQIDLGLDYGLPEAADARSNGDGTKEGLRLTSEGASAGTSSGPSAGGAGSAAA